MLRMWSVHCFSRTHSCLLKCLYSLVNPVIVTTFLLTSTLYYKYLTNWAKYFWSIESAFFRYIGWNLYANLLIICEVIKKTKLDPFCEHAVDDSLLINWFLLYFVKSQLPFSWWLGWDVSVCDGDSYSSLLLMTMCWVCVTDDNMLIVGCWSELHISGCLHLYHVKMKYVEMY